MATQAAAQESIDDLQAQEQQIVSALRGALRKLAGAADPANLARIIEKAFRQEFPAEKADNRLANAVARGITARQKLMAAEGGSWSAEEAAQELGISKAAILKRYQKGQLVAWREERQNAVRFPVWQFKDHKVLEGLEETLKTLRAGSPLDDFGRLLFFLSQPRFLGGKRPLDCLREGDLKRAFQAAEGYGG